ncbi:MAG: Ger(x)C family spore germination protein [Clostridia bacterium]|nr:Ger(x)C family spore germination protein [Clostridia bacterium]
MIKLNKILLIHAVLILLYVLTAGCADSKDINNKSILTAIALDKKDDEIYLYVEIANVEGSNKSEGKNGGKGHKYIYIKSHGKTIPEARENLNKQLEKQPYLSAVRSLIFTEAFAKEYLVEYLYRVRADELYRKKTVTVITKEDPEELFKVSNEKNESAGFSIEDMLNTLENAGESFSRTTSRLLENLSNRYTGIIIPCIGLQNEDIILSGYSVINGTTITGFIPAEESKGTIFFKTDQPKFSFIIPYKDNNLTIETSLKKRKIKPSYKNKKINYDMKFNFEATLMYGNKKTPYNFNEAANKEVTKILTEMLKKELTDAVEQAQKKYKCDYLQFDDYFRVKFPVEFEKMDWENEFSKAGYNIDVKVKLTGTYMMDYETNEQK